MRVAVLVKQVPRFEGMALGPDGRLSRQGVELEMNPYCRRAVAKGVELARQNAGKCTAFSMGPPSAEDVLREALAWGADEGVLISDPAFAGSDTLATSRALAAALNLVGPFDLVLAGRNSVDADTGQVPPELAELLGLPFLGGVRVLELNSSSAGSRLRARCELDDGWVWAEVAPPALLSCAERLCEPAKVDLQGRQSVAPERIRRLGAEDLGHGPWGQPGSATKVGGVRHLEVARQRFRLTGSVPEQVRRAVTVMRDRGALTDCGEPSDIEDQAGSAVVGSRGASTEAGAQLLMVVVVEPGRARLARELLGAAAELASRASRAMGAGSCVCAVAFRSAGAGTLDPALAGGWGADEVLALQGCQVEEDCASALALWCEETQPWAVLVPGTMWGREVAGRVAARLQAGLTGDAVDLSVEEGRLVCWKPAFGGQLVASVTATSAIQMATVRPGVLALRRPRPGPPALPITRAVEARGRVRRLECGRDDDLEVLGAAEVVIGVGTGVNPEEYPLLEPLRVLLGAELAATRKVTDRGWLPRARQVGITGRSIAPRLYLAIGLAGRFTHVVGVRGAGMVVAVNADPDAPVFDSADVGIVADWHEAVPLLVGELGRQLVPDGCRNSAKGCYPERPEIGDHRPLSELDS